MSERNRIALLIDCDNASPKAIEGVLEELSRHGMVNVRHAHGDWNSPNLSGWRNILHANAIRPIQQFAYTKQKDATDAAMIIDAMDLLYTGAIDTFALMTSDSDFTPLVMRILESGLPVYGFGEDKTPSAFVDACSTFIYTENLVASKDDEKQGQQKKRKSSEELRQDSRLVGMLRTAVEQTSGDDDWALLSKVGSYISNNSSLSPVNYGFKKWSDLVRAIELFDVDMRQGNHMYVKTRTPPKKTGSRTKRKK